MRVPGPVSAWYFLSLIVSIYAQDLDPIVNMCIRFDHQSILKNGTLYIDGGRQTFIDVDDSGDQVGKITEGYNNYLIAVDMNNSWDWKANISETALNKTANSNTGTYPPILSRGALYHGADDDDNIYLWGGTTSEWNTSFPGYQGPSVQQYSLWSYNLVTEVWNQFDVTLDSPNRPNSGSHAEATDQGLTFYMNGVLDNGSELETEGLIPNSKQYLQGMIVIDTNNQTAKNLSTNAVVGTTPRSRGQMQYISGIGANGILVQIGGNQQSINNCTDSWVNGDLVPMNEIDIFDVSSYYNASVPAGTWYKQTTSGPTPDPRVDFCAVVASAPDGSSHNIYVYGGRGNNNYFIDDVWVLSLPSFTWTQIYEGLSPRYSHTCHVAGNRTMITVGGAANANYSAAPCDWEYKGVGVFDMSDATWGSVYNASTGDYAVPSLVVKTIGGSASGGATMTQPSGGFNQIGLEQLFRTPINASSDPVSNSTTSSPTPWTSANSYPTISASSTTLGSHPSHSMAPIAGGVAGGIALLASVIAGFFYRKRLRHLIVGGEWPSEELDGENIVRQEIMDTETIWELPASEKPIELETPMDGWSSTDRSSTGRSSTGRSSTGRSSTGRSGTGRSVAGHSIAERSSSTGWKSKPLPMAPPLPPKDWI